jgi:phosphoglycolate phosphatase-like HAD superfamily hydrolase
MNDPFHDWIDSGLGKVTGRRNVLKGASGLALGTLGPGRLDGGDRAAHTALLSHGATPAVAQDGPLPSWNDGSTRQALLDFIAAATEEGGDGFVPEEERIATFDQDGTLWVEQPIYTQAVFAIDQVKALAPEHPDWKTTEPYSVILSGDEQAMAAFSEKNWEQIVGVTHAGMTVEEFQQIVADWMASAKNAHFDRLYRELAYQPMLEVMDLLRGNGFRTYIVSGGGQGFIRAYAGDVYGIPSEQVIGTTFETAYGYGDDGAPTLTKVARLQLNNNDAGKPQDINLFIGKQPAIAFGNSTGDQQMLEWANAGERARLAVLIYHDDAEREYAYGPAGGLPNTHVGTLAEALMTEAKHDGWAVVSMKNDWNRIFPWSA